ncbi:hypothetical protein RCH10_000797 [Variovorax sp. GrIS 2.14]|jgi:hypothetical protein
MSHCLFGLPRAPTAKALEGGSDKAPRKLVDQPTPMPRTQHGAELYQWWRLPSMQVIEIRRIAGTASPECVVRNVNADGEMSTGEYVLSLRFIVIHGKQVKK